MRGPQFGMVLPDPNVRLDNAYYTLEQLSQIFGVPERHFRQAVREGLLNGRKVGKLYIVSAEQFKNFIESGNFDYRPRRRHGHHHLRQSTDD